MKLNEKKYLQTDDSVVIFTDESELTQYLSFRKENDEWIHAFINELGAIGIINAPLLYHEQCTNIELNRVTYQMPVEDIDYESIAGNECITEGPGLFLVLPYKNKMVPFPIRWCAYNTICQRTDDFCGTMTRFEEKNSKKVLPIDEKAERINRDFLLYNGRCKSLYRDGKISAVHSEDYVILPCDELMDIFKQKMTYEHPDMQFDGGMVSHEFLVANYLLNDRAMEEEIRIKLNSKGSNITSLKSGIRFSSSDIGMSSVCLSVFFIIDGTQIFLDGEKTPHRGNVSLESFSEKLDSVACILKDCSDSIENLGNMDIQDVSKVVQIIVEENTHIFPMKVAEEVIDECKAKFPTGGTGIDVFIALNDIVDRHIFRTEQTPTRYLQLTEMVAKLIGLPYDKIESGEYDFKKK